MQIRAFFSIELPLAAKKIIAHQLIPALQKKCHSHVIRWTKMDNLHITLQFLKEIDALDVDKLIKNVEIELKDSKIFSLELHKPELFPSLERPRTISLSMGSEDIVSRLSKQIGNGIQKTNYPVETRPFRGHLTLGRINERKSGDISLNDVVLPRFDKIEIKEIVFFRSEPAKDGSHYTELARFDLKR